MEAVMSASQGAMGSLLGKLGELLTEEYKLQKGVKGEVMFLKAEMESIHAFLQKLSGVEELDGQVKAWRDEVRELSYDMEDCIDDFMLRVASEPKSKPHGFKRFMERSVDLLTKTKTRHRIAKAIQGLKARVVEARERHERYKLDEAAVSRPSSYVGIDPRLRALYAEEGDLVGIDGPRDDLIGRLTEEGSETARRLKVVSIVGCGGLGKTTLASQVYRKLKGQFQCAAFVSVSQKPDLVKIFRDILSQLSGQDRASMDAWDAHQLIRKIREFLEDKRYFIIIDDIWSIPAWRDIQCALLENNRGSRIMTTTRILDVAKSCCSPWGDGVCEMNSLSSDDSSKLFFARIFGSEYGCPPQIKEVSDQILKRCGGLPLAIITIASLLANNSTSKIHWEKVLDSLGSAFGKNSNMEEMKRILSLSYDELPCYLKTCLLYLSMFSEDYIIMRERLVMRWMAEGFIKEEGGLNREEVGEYYFNELINRSMIQPVNISYDGLAVACRVHDMILDVIVSKSVEENVTTLLGNEKHPPMLQHKARRLSLDYPDRTDCMIPSTFTFCQVRSLSFFGNAEHLPPLVHFRLLRVLDLQDCVNLTNHHLNNIGRLVWLKYLGLRGKIIELPEQIGELQYLETLDIYNTYIKKLPISIVRLQQLVYLVGSELNLPEGIGNMHALQVLFGVSVSVCSSTVNLIEELGSLTNLRRLRMYLRFVDADIDKEAYKNILVSSLSKLVKSSLRFLNIISNCDYAQEFLLDSWTLPPNLLQGIWLHGSVFFRRIPEWMASLHNLTKLTIHSINQVCEDGMQLLGDLSALLFLSISFLGAAPLKKLIIGSKGFQCLKSFFFPRYGGLGLMFEGGAMPKLETLYLQFFVLETKSLYGDFDFGLQHLSHLKDVEVHIVCRGAEVLEVEAAEAAIKGATDMLPNHPNVFIGRI